ncbi:MAG: hypothetical protein NW237_03945 [Cyanobacteriota bacterium]|nr:hypothetical protein [Cyanobacteriota bacterium]
MNKRTIDCGTCTLTTIPDPLDPVIEHIVVQAKPGCHVLVKVNGQVAGCTTNPIQMEGYDQRHHRRKVTAKRAKQHAQRLDKLADKREEQFAPGDR